ncbi:MAG TPA: condensation domain-containing protein, partial [Verrucomicrobiae bacterium]|nr:condensation domain-containing protein [Verrucomicrobiae bacterium]
MRPVPRDQPLPLSFAQQRLWFIQQSDPQGIAYNLSFAWQLSGSLNVRALERSLSAIVHRHESLRTLFADCDGQPVQIISSLQMQELKWIDLQPWPEAERSAEAARRLAQESRRPFDLAHGPLLRTLLLCLGETSHVLLLTMHHIVCDAASLKILFRELQAFYGEYSMGRPVALPDLEVQYADFAAWQRRWLQAGVLERQLSYWKHQLQGHLPMLELPTDRTRPPEQTARGALHHFRLPMELAQSINRLKRQEGTTLFNVLLAAFKALIHRYTGQEDIVIGSMTANRNRPEIRDLIGFFVNTQVLRTRVTGELSFHELLGRVKEVALGAYSHQDVPFERLVEELRPTRELSHTPLFQVMFSFQSLPRRGLELPGLEVRMLEVDNGTSKFDLTLDVNETREGIVGFFEYNTDLFDAATIQRMAGHYQNLLAGAVASPNQPLWTLPLLPETERNQILVEWNNTMSGYDRTACVHQLFESQVRRSPDAVAATIGNQSLTYRELDRRANHAAAHLQGLGVGPETLVGILMERSWEMLGAILGVLKAGGAYVPLDPSFPQDRLAFMMEDAKISVLLTQSKLKSHLDIPGVRTVFLDAVLAKHENETDLRTDTSAAMTPANPAYVIFTSGSTGKPKGVVVSHRAVVNFLTSMRQCPGLAAADKLLAITTISFDIAALELLLPLTVGAQVVLATSETAMTPAALAAQIENDGITVMQATPTTWRMLVESGWKGNPRLKILCGGESLSPELAVKLRERCGSLWNMYGPTETTIWSAV